MLKLFIMLCLVIYCILLILKVKKQLIKNRELIYIKEQEMIEYNTNKKQTINNILDTLETVQSNLRRIKKDEENYHVENMGYTFIASDMTSLNKNNNNHNEMNNY